MSKGRPEITVIIPVYNRRSLLKLCINSLLKQKTSFKFEILIIDDCSTDGTRQLAAEFAKKNPKIKTILLKKKYGSAMARNKGIMASNSKVLAFIDSDCVAEKNWLQRLTKDLVSGKESVSRGYSKGFKGNVWQNITQEAYLDYQKSICRDDFAVSLDTRNCAVKKEIFDRLGGFRTKLAGDLDMSWRIYDEGDVILFVKNAIIYHKHRASLLEDVLVNARSASYVAIIMFKNRKIDGNYFRRVLFGAATPLVLISSFFLPIKWGIAIWIGILLIYGAFSLRGSHKIFWNRVLYKLLQAIGQGYGFTVGLVLIPFEWKLKRYKV